MTEVQPRMKPLIDCACGCGLVGAPATRAFADGERHCRPCVCVRCRGRANRSNGDKAGDKVRRLLKLNGPNTRHEAGWLGCLRTEVKSGEQCTGAVTLLTRAWAQSEGERPIGDNRPNAVVLSPTHGKPWVCVRESDLERVAAAFAEREGWI